MFDVGCPTCGEDMTQVADGRPHLVETSVIVRCKPCKQSFQLRVKVDRLNGHQSRFKHVGSMGQVSQPAPSGAPTPEPCSSGSGTNNDGRNT